MAEETWWACRACGQAYNTTNPEEQWCPGSPNVIHDPLVVSVRVDSARIIDRNERNERGRVHPTPLVQHRACCPSHPDQNCLPIEPTPDGGLSLFCAECAKRYPLCAMKHATKKLPCFLHANHEGVHGHGSLEWPRNEEERHATEA
jgi:hypothetical protein